MRTPYRYDACIRKTQRCPEAPATHAVVRFWSVSPAPHVVAAFASVVDGMCSSRLGRGACATVETLHAESTTCALVVRLPCSPDEEPDAEASAAALVAEAMGVIRGGVMRVTM